MAQVTVNHQEKSYTVDNGVNVNAFKFNNQAGTNERTFLIESINIDVSNLNYEFRFVEKDTDIINNYIGPNIGRMAVFGDLLPVWISQGKLELRPLKISALNAIFKSKLEIEPLNSDGTVKIEFQ